MAWLPRALAVCILLGCCSSVTAQPCDGLALQVFLDRQGFSPGVIDGKAGTNTARALAAYREAIGTDAPGRMPVDCSTPVGTSGTARVSGTRSYEISAEDAAGPFEALPKEIADLAGRPAVGYESLLEKLAERFHTSPAFLQSLNRHVSLAAGASITVPDVPPFDPQLKPQRSPDNNSSIEVTREGELRVRSAEGALLFYAPASSGSEHDPLPPGNWKVTGVSWLPVFHYNPALFWDADSTDKKTVVAAGPNNPVGVVWVDINVPHYGLHGTPEPTKIGYVQSHGCVRLTNWDAARLASLVTVGSPVVFK